MFGLKLKLRVIYTHLMLWEAVAGQHFKWVKCKVFHLNLQPLQREAGALG